MKGIIFLIAFITLTSCGESRSDISCEFNGGIIIGAYPNVGPLYDIKLNGEIITFVRGFDIDDGYQVGDTINRPCVGGVAESKVKYVDR